MAKHSNQSGNVVGVFMDQAHADQAIRALNDAGFNAQVADEQALQEFGNVGLEREVVDMYRSRANEGNIIVTANGQGRGDEALGIMLQNGAEYINLANRGQYAEGQQASGGQQGQAYDSNSYNNLPADQRQYGQSDPNLDRARSADEMRVALREETLTPVKQSQQAGEVRAHKVVHEREQQVPVNLTREEVYIERNPVDRPLAEGEVGDLQDEVIRVPVYEEQAELQKQARVREEVTLGKRDVQEQQTLAGTTRHEHLQVENSGDLEIQGDTGSDVRTDGEAYDTTGRDNWNQDQTNA